MITSNGGGDAATLYVHENGTPVTTVTSDVAATYSITGGADAAKFTVDGVSGILSFVSAPDFEAPTDVGADNTYNVTVRATDQGARTDDQALAVKVTSIPDTTPYLVSTQSNVTIQSIITTGDQAGNSFKADGTPYLMGGTPDGLGMYDNGDGTVTVLENQEIALPGGIARAHGGTGAYVTQFVIDKASLQVVSGKDAFSTVKLWDSVNHVFVETANVSFSRFCSADLPEVSAYYNAASGLGTQDRIFMTGEEPGAEGRQLGVVTTGAEAGTAFELAYMGKFSHENAVANAFAQDKTIVMGTDDAGGGKGQVYVYVGQKQSTGSAVEKAGLVGGTLYGIAVNGITQETNATYPTNTTFSLVSLGDVNAKTGAQLETASNAAGVTQFLRPEDISWDPTNAARGYFVTTNALNQPTRLYQFVFTDITHPELGGTITQVLDGTEGAQMFDNITVGTDGKVTLCEDPGNTPYVAKVWQYDPATDKLTQIAVHDPSRFAVGGANFLTVDEESSGVIDVTATFGDANTRAYLIDTQNHALATGPNAAELVEGGQLMLMKITNNAPVIASNGGGDTATVSVAERTTAVTTVTATDDATDTVAYSINGGADAAKFAIDTKTGALSFKTAPVYEFPTDAGLDNTYDVTVRATDEGGRTDDQALAVKVTNQPFTLQLLSFSDEEGGQLATSTAYRLAGLVQGFKSQNANTVVVSGGDTYIPGPFDAAGTDNSIGAVVPGSGNAPARPDVAILNAIGIDAAAIGNHEFDLGSNVFASAIGASSPWVGAQYPYLSANLDFSGDTFLASKFVNTTGTAGLEETTSLKGKVAPSAVKTVNGEKIGIIGLTGQNLLSLTSPNGTKVKGDPTGVIDVNLAAAQVQATVDDLTSQGVNKIILTTDSNSVSFDTQLSTLVHGVDVIVAGGEHLRGGDANDTAATFPGHAANFDVTLPIISQGTDGAKVLIVTSDSEYTYLDRLVIGFNADGTIDTSTLDSTVNGAYAATDANVAAAWGTTVDNLASTAYAAGTKASNVKAITDAIGNVISVKDGTVYGYSNVYLEGERNSVRFQETNLGDLSADANASAARAALGLSSDVALVSIKNGGGIRNAVGFIDENGAKLPNVANPGVGKPAGAISQLDVENSLRFNNGLMVFDTTAQGLLNILNSPNAENKSNGGFIQIGGVRFSYDPSKPVGSRVQDVVLVNEAGQITARIADNGVVLAGAPSLIQGIVLNFTANGGDNYAFKANATNFRFVKTDGTLSAAVDPALDFTSATTIATYTGSATGLLGEQAVLETYLSTKFATPATAFNLADTPEAQDIRIQNQAARTDTVLVGDYLLGPATSNFAENGSGVVYVAATTGLNGAATSYSVSGPDAARFQIDATTGALTFAASPDFERPTDQGLNNIYELTLVASDGASTATQKLSITVTDVLDTASYTGTAGPNTFTANSAFDWTISGLAGNDVLTGNVGKDTIYGGAGQDVLDGGQGADLLLGGLGGDTYIVDNSGDQVVELAGEGADLVKASVSYTLSANVENLDLTGGDPINAVGNELANVINGNNGDNVLAGFQGNDTLRGGAGNDTLAGGPGADTLTGGPGSDRFVFDSLETSQKRDLITDFAAGEDKIVLSSDAFTGLTGAGALTADQFGVGAKATTAAQRVIYNPVTGALSYDADGKGAGAAVVVAVLTGRPSIGASDIEVHPSAGLTPSINLMAQAAASFGGGAEVFVGSGLSNDNASRPQLLNLASRA